MQQSGECVLPKVAKRGDIQPGSELYGKAFENWVFHELTAYNAYRELDCEFSYWRLASGIEVDFVVNHCQVAIEAKASRMVHDGHLKGLRELGKDKPRVERRIVVSLDPKQRKTVDGIEVLPALEFVSQLWAGVFF